jgi:hypothetical protein
MLAMDVLTFPEHVILEVIGEEKEPAFIVRL